MVVVHVKESRGFVCVCVWCVCVYVCDCARVCVNQCACYSMSIRSAHQGGGLRSIDVQSRSPRIIYSNDNNVQVQNHRLYPSPVFPETGTVSIDLPIPSIVLIIDPPIPSIVCIAPTAPTAPTTPTASTASTVPSIPFIVVAHIVPVAVVTLTSNAFPSATLMPIDIPQVPLHSFNQLPPIATPIIAATSSGAAIAIRPPPFAPSFASLSSFLKPFEELPSAAPSQMTLHLLYNHRRRPHAAVEAAVEGIVAPNACYPPAHHFPLPRFIPPSPCLLHRNVALPTHQHRGVVVILITT